MARKLRIQYAGAIYHVMNRGDRDNAIYLDDQDRRSFLETLGQACQKTGWRVHAYCLMRNHFHLVVETPQPNLVDGMKWLLGTYTGRFNRRHQEWGHLFSGRYKALVVDGSGSGYLKAVCDYIHLSPSRAGVLKRAQALTDYAWSSFPHYLLGPAHRPTWLQVDRLLGEWRIPKDNPAGRQNFLESMEQRRGEGMAADELKGIERGWCLGDKAFQKKLVEKLTHTPGTSLSGEALREAQEYQAEQIITAGLKRKGWTEADLRSRRKGDPGKVELARALRDQTTLSLAWIAQRLHMGSFGYMALLLQQRKKTRRPVSLKREKA